MQGLVSISRLRTAGWRRGLCSRIDLIHTHNSPRGILSFPTEPSPAQGLRCPPAWESAAIVCAKAQVPAGAPQACLPFHAQQSLPLAPRTPTLSPRSGFFSSTATSQVSWLWLLRVFTGRSQPDQPGSCLTTPLPSRLPWAQPPPGPAISPALSHLPFETGALGSELQPHLPKRP